MVLPIEEDEVSTVVEMVEERVPTVEERLDDFIFNERIFQVNSNQLLDDTDALLGRDTTNSRRRRNELVTWADDRSHRSNRQRLSHEPPNELPNEIVVSAPTVLRNMRDDNSDARRRLFDCVLGDDGTRYIERNRSDRRNLFNFVHDDNGRLYRLNPDDWNLPIDMESWIIHISILEADRHNRVNTPADFLRVRALRVRAMKVHTVIMYQWLTQVFGPLNNPDITPSYIKRLLYDEFDSGLIPLNGTIVSFYSGLESQFWADIRNHPIV
jgi:hypothetical protein